MVRESVELLRQRSYRLGEQTHFAGVEGQFAFVGSEYRPFRGDDIAEIPVLERLVRFRASGVVGHVDLKAPRGVLQGRERDLAHDPFQHHPAGDRGGHLVLLELLLRLRGVDLCQVGGEFLAAEVVRIGVALGALSSLLSSIPTPPASSLP